MIILPSITNGSIGGSYESFPYLPRPILDNNSFADDFINLPTDGFGVPRWTENAPPGWSQYSPYYYVFLKWYLKAKEIDENVADGGGRVHALKAGGIGSSLGLTPDRMLTLCPISCSPSVNPDWSIYSISQTISITTENFVNFGCFLKVLNQDPLRPLNIAGIALYFTKSFRKSYFNYSLVHGGDSFNISLIPGDSSSYTYFNTYDASKVYEAYNQWIGQPIIKIKGLAKTNQSSIFNQWQFLNYKIDIPTFTNTPQDDGITGKADSCTMMIFFGENNGYLDDGSGSRSGSVQFLRPFLSLS